MYAVNTASNSIIPVPSRTFGELGFREREHLQEWIAKNPEVFGEELLIIQKEFSGWSDTNDRLDLLALDKQGSLVIIENKLDDSGRDVVWQVLRYASYCAGLSRQNIRDAYQTFLDRTGSGGRAEDRLTEFLEVDDFAEAKLNVGSSQRIIMVAANFRKEVTSTALWLMSYKLRIQCFKVVPYTMGDQTFVSFDQIIPLREAEEYTISMASKSQEDIESQEEAKSRHQVRRRFWTALLSAMNEQTDTFRNISPSKDSWISASTGVSGIAYNAVAGRDGARVELYISRASAAENKAVFDWLREQSAEIEEAFGGPLIWQRLEDRKASRVSCHLDGVSLYEESDWPRITEFLCDAMVRLVKAFSGPIGKTRAYLARHLPQGGE